MRHLLTVTVPGDIQAPLSLLFQRRSILKLFKRLTVVYALPGTPLDIRQKARVLWQSLSLLSQCSEHVTIPQNFRICVRALRTRAHVISRLNSTDIRLSCSPHPLIVDCLLAPPTLCTYNNYYNNYYNMTYQNNPQSLLINEITLITHHMTVT